MAKYAVKFEVEVIVDEDFNIGEIDEDITEKLGDAQYSDQWDSIVCDAMNVMEDLQNNVVSVIRLEDEEDEESVMDEMPWDYGKHFD